MHSKDKVDEQKSFRFRVGKGKVIKALDVAVRTMVVGEHSRFLCSPRYTFGTMGLQLGEDKQISSNLLIEIELLDLEKNEEQLVSLPTLYIQMVDKIC